MSFNMGMDEVKSLEDQVMEFFKAGLIDQAWNDETVTFSDEIEIDIHKMVNEAASLSHLDVSDNAPVYQWAAEAAGWWDSLGDMPQDTLPPDYPSEDDIDDMYRSYYGFR